MFRINDQLHYFAHAPKCGGTSVEAYLTTRFGPLGFSEAVRNRSAPDDYWSRSHAQHIPVVSLFRIIPRDWIVSSFAVVRHPVRRLISVFHFNRDVTGLIPLTADFNDWCQDALPRLEADPFRYDGHLLPQTAFIPNSARIFRLEDGLHHIPPHIDSLVGKSDGPAEVPALLVGRWRTEGPPPTPTPATLSLAARIYATDFARFGYEMPETVADATALPDLPALAATGKPPAPRRQPFARRLYRKLLLRAGLK